MKKLNLMTMVICMMVMVVIIESCKKVDCPEGYIGDNCEKIDTAQIQALLDKGVSPKTLYDGGVSLDQLYGKKYKDGLIFYLSTSTGTGMVAAEQDQSTTAEWGCNGTDIINLSNVNSNIAYPEYAEGAKIGDGKANTDAILAGCVTSGIAAKVCRDKGTEWFLPSRGELDLLYTNLRKKGNSGFEPGGFYWSSTEYNNSYAWYRNFTDSFLQFNFSKKDYLGYVRAAKAF